jgi:ABC-type phosphate transport system auxiliary subunit
VCFLLGGSLFIIVFRIIGFLYYLCNLGLSWFWKCRVILQWVALCAAVALAESVSGNEGETLES